jgi:hypothetical protein
MSGESRLRCVRCGWDSDTGPHPCHRCRSAPGTLREVLYTPAQLGGAIREPSVFQTWACDPCWQTWERWMDELADAMVERGVTGELLPKTGKLV